jgi:DNA-binding NarL/FixJ family response regulator
MLNILCVDDHEVVLEGIKKILVEMIGDVSVGEAKTGHEAILRVRERNWDVAILDISLVGMSGLDVLKEIKSIRPSLPVLILSMHCEEQYAFRAFKAGAAGYLTKCAPREEMITAISKVVKGGRYVSSALAEKMVVSISGSSDTAKNLHETLSDREFGVLRMIASGKTVGEIAHELSLSAKTISTYRARILEKMHMRTSAELTHYAITNKLTE